MNDHLFGIPNMDVYIVLGIIVAFILAEIIAGYWKTERNFGDWFLEAGGFFILSLLTKPGIVIVGLIVMNTFIPDYAGSIGGMSLLWATILYLLVDDILQYWYHRSAHEYQFLWKLHRAHHQAEEMGFLVAYRNAWMYYVTMPNLWWGGVLTFLGGAKAVAIGLILKQVIVIGAHSTVPWDKYLYKLKWFSPIMTVLERIIVTPAFHYSHHGKSMKDGISDPNGNFGNMFSIWDQLFGTAKFTRQFPSDLGLVNDPKEHWSAAYLYPFVASNDKNSEMSRGFKKNDTTTLEPATVKLIKGETYLWCQCGRSKNQPFCDGTHQGSKVKPMPFEAKRTGEVRLCNCKATKAGPFCDDSHIELKKD